MQAGVVFFAVRVDGASLVAGGFESASNSLTS
jgi:hypothetical protein